MPSDTPYRVLTVTLAAGEERAMPFPTDYVALISATADTSVTVRLSESGSAAPLLVGLTPTGLGAPRFWLGNTSAAANAVQIAIGVGATIADNRQLNGVLAQDINLKQLAGATAVGQKTKAFSLSAVLASDQTAIPTQVAAVAALASGQTAAMTGTADETVIAAPGAGSRIYVHTLLVSNKHATTGTEIIIKSAAVEILRVWAPANSCFPVALPAPLRLADNAALIATNVTTASDTRVAAAGFLGA